MADGRQLNKGFRRLVTVRQRNRWRAGGVSASRGAGLQRSSGDHSLRTIRQRTCPRRRLQGHHRAAPARRPPVVRRDRQGRRTLRGRRTAARPAADRQRCHAGGRGHRPPGARLRPAGDDRDPCPGTARAGRRRARRDGRGRLRRGDRRLVRPARGGRLRERRGSAPGAVGQDPHDRARGLHRDVHVPQASQADLLLGCPLSPRSSYADLSFWHDTLPEEWAPRESLPGDVDADVAVVGGGLTGLWTAYYLLEADPGLRVVVLEAETAGFGASGRNGGWCSALFPTPPSALAALPDSGAAKARAQHQAMRETVDEVLRVLAVEGIDAHQHKGGTVSLARSASQLRRAVAEVEEARAWGRGEDDLRLLGADEALVRLAARRTVGATFTPDCAAVHPARLVRGLARAVERRGGVVHERTRVLAISPGEARTAHGRVRAEVVVRATEGYTGDLAGRRSIVPVYSLVVATEPLDADTWERIGLRDRETFSDHRNLIIYGQRTADGRLVFGGRGAPYHFGSATRPSYDRDARVFATLRSTLVDMFPVLERTRFTHAWGGALGIPRDWCASVGLERRTGLAWAGGYVGDGLSTTNLAGRTLRDLVLGWTTGLTDLPWVDHRSRSWEPEPLRWVGVNAGLRAMAFADHEERLTRRPSVVAQAMAPLLGGH